MKSNLIEPLQDNPMAGGERRDLEHLQALARATREVFVPQERNRLSAPGSNRTVEGADAAMQRQQRSWGRRCDPYYHSGLNE